MSCAHAGSRSEAKAAERHLLLREEDIEELFTGSSGPGGQHVNKNQTCVRLRHIPTGIEVRCQQERSQARNRLRAREILAVQVAAAAAAQAAARQREQERLRRKNRRRPIALKERILEHKRRRGALKRFRGRVHDEE